MCIMRSNTSEGIAAILEVLDSAAPQYFNYIEIESEALLSKLEKVVYRSMMDFAEELNE